MKVALCSSTFGKKGDVSGHNSPTFCKPNPDLALATLNNSVGRISCEFNRDAGKVSTEAYDLQASDGAHEIVCRSGFAESFQLCLPVEVFCDPKPHDLSRSPEHVDEGVDIVLDQCSFVSRVQLVQLGEDVGEIDLPGVDGHVPLCGELWFQDEAR